MFDANREVDSIPCWVPRRLLLGAGVSPEWLERSATYWECVYGYSLRKVFWPGDAPPQSLGAATALAVEAATALDDEVPVPGDVLYRWDIVGPKWRRQTAVEVVNALDAASQIDGNGLF